MLYMGLAHLFMIKNSVTNLQGILSKNMKIKLIVVMNQLTLNKLILAVHVKIELLHVWN